MAIVFYPLIFRWPLTQFILQPRLPPFWLRLCLSAPSVRLREFAFRTLRPATMVDLFAVYELLRLRLLYLAALPRWGHWCAIFGVILPGIRAPLGGMIGRAAGSWLGDILVRRFIKNMFHWIGERKITLFYRDKFPVCYEIASPLVEGDKLPDVLNTLRSSFSWSIRSWPHDEDSAGTCPVQIPRVRDMLKNWQESRVLEAVRFRDQYSNGLFIELFGFEIDGESNALETREIYCQLRHFVKSEPSAIKMVIIRLEDTPFWYVFVPQILSEPAKSVLKSFGIGDKTIIGRRSYCQLHGMAVEEFYKQELM